MVNFINFTNKRLYPERDKDQCLIDIYLKSLSYHYNNKNFKDLLDEINIRILSNGFLTQEVKQKVIKNYNLNRKFMNIIRNYRNKLNQEKRSIINSKFLNLEFTNKSSLDNNIIITENNTNKIYLFTPEEMISIFKMALLNQEESISSPSYPKNPYTNIKFTIKEQIYIISKINEYCYKNKKSLHIVLKMYNDCQFDPIILSNIHGNYLGIQACKNYVKSLVKEDFNDLVREFIIDYKLNRKVCYKCMLEKYNNDLKTIFLPLIIKYQCENNSLYTGSLSSSKMMKNIIKNEKLNIEKRHFMKHRKLVVITGRKIVNVPNNYTNNAYQFNINEPINYNFGNSSNNNEMFIFGASDNNTSTTNTSSMIRPINRSRILRRSRLNTSNIYDNNVNVGMIRRIRSSISNITRRSRRRINFREDTVDIRETEEESILGDFGESIFIESNEHVEKDEEEEENETIEQSDNDDEEEEEDDETIEQSDNDDEEDEEDEDETIEQSDNDDEEEEEEETIEQSRNDNEEDDDENNNSLLITRRHLFSSPEYISSSRQDTELRIRIPIIDIPSRYDIEDRFSQLVTNYTDSNIYDISYNLEETFEEVTNNSSDNIKNLLNSIIEDKKGIVEINIDDKYSLENFVINCPEKLHSKVTIITENSKINGIDLTIIKKGLLNNIIKVYEKEEEEEENQLVKADSFNEDLINYDEIEDEIVL
jgi:hypothetical protein